MRADTTADATPGVMILYDDAAALHEVDDCALGELMRAFFSWYVKRDAPEPSNPFARAYLALLRQRAEGCFARYRKRRDQRMDAAKARWDANACDRMNLDANTCELMRPHTKEKKRKEKKGENKENETVGGGAGGSDKPAMRRFTPPTVEEVRAYCAEIKAGIDPAYFVDHYAANGWRVGKAPMKDWRAAVRTWTRRDFDGPGSASGPGPDAERQAKEREAKADALAAKFLADREREDREAERAASAAPPPASAGEEVLSW